MPSPRVVWLFLQFPLACSVLLNRQGVDLQRDRVSASYRLALDRAYDCFTWRCIVHSPSVPESTKSAEESLNNMLSGYVQFLSDMSYGVSASRQAVLAAQTRFRHLRCRPNVARDSVKSRVLKAPVKLRTPLWSSTPCLPLPRSWAFPQLDELTASGCPSVADFSPVPTGLDAQVNGPCSRLGRLCHPLRDCCDWFAEVGLRSATGRIAANRL